MKTSFITSKHEHSVAHKKQLLGVIWHQYQLTQTGRKW